MTLRNPQTALAAALGVLALLIGVAGVFVVVLPQRSQAGSLRQQLNSADAALAAARTPQPTSHSPSERAADLFRLMEAMPSNNEMPGILLDLQALARLSSVSVTSVKPGTVIPLASGDSALPIVVDVTGSFAGVTSFLRLMREAVQDGNSHLAVSGRLLVTNTVQLSSADGKVVQAALNLDAFDYSAPLALPATVSGPATTTSAG